MAGRYDTRFLLLLCKSDQTDLPVKQIAEIDKPLPTVLVGGKASEVDVLDDSGRLDVSVKVERGFLVRYHMAR